MSNNTGAPPPLRKFSWPFPKTDTSASGQPSSREVTDPQDYYDALALAEDGFYPIGANGQWHGGIHFGRQTGTLLDQDNGLRCIADGEVIAWKIDDTYPTVAYDTCGAATYSTGFVLVRHRLALPATPAPDGTTDASDEDDDAPTLLFYSLYMHLLDWQGYRQHPDRPRPSFWGDDTYTVAGQANDSERTNRQPNPYLPPDGVGLNLRDATNAYAGFAPRGTRVRLGEEGPVGGYFAVTGIVGDAVLAPGVTQVYAFRGELTPVPAEPDVKDGVVVPETPIPIAAGALVGHLGEYKRYIDVDPLCSSEARPLAQIDVFATQDIEAFIGASRTRAAHLPDAAKTLLVVDRGARLVVPTGASETPSAAQLAAAQGAGGGPVAHCTRVLPIKALTAVTEDDGTRWWPVDVGIRGGETASGWVRERDHAHVRLASPWEWPGFEIVRVDDIRPDQFYARHAAQQGQAAPDEQSALEQSGAAVDTGPIFRKLYETIDDSGDSRITADEIRRALRKPWLAQALSHLIIEHESEWSGPMDKWDAIDPLIPENRKADWAKEKERIASLLWWGDAKGQHGLPGDEPLVAHNIHPAGLLAVVLSGRRHPVIVNNNQTVELEFLDFYDRTVIEDTDYQEAADRLGCEMEAIKAVAMAETGATGSYFSFHDWDQVPAILYERHYFHRITGGTHSASNPDISNASRGNYGRYSAQYRKLLEAYALNSNAALRSASWGRFQIMGENHVAAGYATVEEFVRDISESEKNHLKAFVNFIESDRRLSTSIVDRDWLSFARAYNGPAQSGYDTKMESNYDALVAERR